MSFKVEIKGLMELQLKVKNFNSNLNKEATAIVERGAQVFVRNAKRDAPVDFGVLRNSITYTKSSGIGFEVISGARYSPYLEWGTITKVDVPAEQSSYAIQFKGSGLKTTGGIKPHPYFFKQIPSAVVTIESGINSLLKTFKP